MISKKWLKYINSIQIKKYRQEYQTFLVEGRKSVAELLKSELKIEIIFCSESFHDEYHKDFGKRPFEICTEEELTKGGSFENNNAAIAIVAFPISNNLISLPKDEIVLILDGIRDPGNLGTIIRTADWYGINHIICSLDTTDVFSPKVIAATMGSFSRVHLEYRNLKHFFEDLKPKKVFGAFLEGENIYKTQLTTNQSICIVIGNESQGIDESIKQFITDKIHIPGSGRAESLNAGIATAIILDNFSRLLSK